MTEAAMNTTQADLFPPPEMMELRERIWRPCWIGYRVAEEGLERLTRLYTHPKTHRPPCCLIVGDTNNGKTTLALKFQQIHNLPAADTEEATIMPVVVVQAPPGADAGALYNGILRAVGAPFSPSTRMDRKQDQVLKLLTNLGTRMLIIDELHNILAGKVDQRSLFLNVLKYLSNELRIPLVGIGTKEVLRAVQTDQQLGNRFEPFFMPRWEANKEYAKFLVQICNHAGFEDSKVAKARAFVTRVHTMSEGLTGETWKAMCIVSEHAETTGKKSLALEMLNEIPWTRPSERRRNIGKV